MVHHSEEVLLEAEAEAQAGSMKNWVLIFVFITCSAFAQDLDSLQPAPFQLNLEDVQNMREINGSRITDASNLLSDSAEQYIDSILISLEDSLGYQIALVNLDSIGDHNMRIFGTDLFNLWEIGQEGNDNGLLIFNVMNIRRIEFITGYGMESVLTDWQCQEIQQVEMVPNYKNGDYELGILNGIKATVDVLQENTPAYLIQPVEEEYEDTYMEDSDYEAYDPNNDNWYYQFVHSANGTIFFMLLGLSTIIALIPSLIFIFRFLQALFSKKLTPHERYKKIWWADHIFIALIFPMPFLFFYPIIKVSRYIWKKQSQGPRGKEIISDKSGAVLTRLNLDEQNLALSKGLIKEDVVGSKLIEIWSDKNYSEIIVKKFDKQWSFWTKPTHGKKYYKYDQCKTCKHKTSDRLSYKKIADDGKYETLRWKYYCDNCEAYSYEDSKSKIVHYSSSSNSNSSSKSSGSYFSRKSSSSSRSSSRKSSSSSSSSSSGSSSYGGGKSGSGGSGSSW